MRDFFAQDPALKMKLTAIADAYERAHDLYPYHSTFLTEGERTLLTNLLSSRVDTIPFTGGFPDAERTILSTDPDALVCLRTEADVTHPDVLGSLMSLGLERDAFGDIVIAEGEIFVAVLRRHAPVVLSLTKIARENVVWRACAFSDAPESEPPTEKMISVASARLDAFVAALFDLSREDAKTAITRGEVTILGLPEDNPATIVPVGATISVRRHGKARIAELLGESRKGRTRFLAEILGRRK